MAAQVGRLAAECHPLPKPRPATPGSCNINQYSTCVEVRSGGPQRQPRPNPSATKLDSPPAAGTSGLPRKNSPSCRTTPSVRWLHPVTIPAAPLQSRQLSHNRSRPHCKLSPSCFWLPHGTLKPLTTDPSNLNPLARIRQLLANKLRAITDFFFRRSLQRASVPGVHGREASQCLVSAASVLL